MIKLFDLGMGAGGVTDILILMFEMLDLADYQIYGFEPSKEAVEFLKEKYQHNERVTILPFAVSDSNRESKLYQASIKDGRSLCVNKRNIIKDRFELCKVVKFSDWFNKLEKSADDIFIVSCDIEGSEYELYRDIIESGISKSIQLFCGSLGDLYKIGKSMQEIESFLDYLDANDIHVYEVSSRKLDKLPLLHTMIKRLTGITTEIPGIIDGITINDPWVNPEEAKPWFVEEEESVVIEEVKPKKIKVEKVPEVKPKKGRGRPKKEKK